MGKPRSRRQAQLDHARTRQRTRRAVILAAVFASAFLAGYLAARTVSAPTARASEPLARAAGAGRAAALRTPRLMDLGAEECPPCQRMVPHLQAFADEQRGFVDVDVFDVWKQPELGELFRVRTVPTQIFYDAQGQEFARHEGFLSKAELAAAFRERGIPLASANSSAR